MPGTGQTTRREFRAEMKYAKRVLSQTEQTTRVETRLLGDTLQMYMTESMQQKESMDLPASRVVADIDRRGQVVEIVADDLSTLNMPQLGGGGAWLSPNWSQYTVFHEDMAELPCTLAGTNQWPTTASIPVTVDGPTLDLTINSGFITLTTFQDQICGKIRSKFSGPLKLDASAMAGVGGMSGTGTMQGDLLWYYDLNRAVYMYGEGHVGMDVSVDMGETGAMTAKMLMNLRSTETGLRE